MVWMHEVFAGDFIRQKAEKRRSLPWRGCNAVQSAEKMTKVSWEEDKSLARRYITRTCAVHCNCISVRSTKKMKSAKKCFSVQSAEKVTAFVFSLPDSLHCSLSLSLQQCLLRCIDLLFVALRNTATQLWRPTTYSIWAYIIFVRLS